MQSHHRLLDLIIAGTDLLSRPCRLLWLNVSRLIGVSGAGLLHVACTVMACHVLIATRCIHRRYNRNFREKMAQSEHERNLARSMARVGKVCSTVMLYLSSTRPAAISSRQLLQHPCHRKA